MTDTTIIDVRRQPHPLPCSDCGRVHLVGEHVVVSAPTPKPNETRAVWEGCVDCWVRRTNPAELDVLRRRIEEAEARADTYAAELERTCHAIDELVAWAKRKNGGDSTLTSEEYFIVTEYGVNTAQDARAALGETDED